MADTEIFLPAQNYDLAATLDSGQVFRWRQNGNSWDGVLRNHFIRLTQKESGIHAQTFSPVADWDFLHNFLQTEVDLNSIVKTFPDDAPMQKAVVSCRGLRLLRQDPWECLASFILSSTKQIVQIRQIVALLCERFGEPVLVGRASSRAVNNLRHVNDGSRGRSPHQFPSSDKIAVASESELRECKMGFRAPNLLATARQIYDGKFDLEKIRQMDYADARHELTKLPGVGNKIADCVLLFAYGFDSAFPVDVWVERALRQLYFPRRKISEKKLRHFAATHFGPHAGYAQQYLFHYMRTKLK